MDTRTSPAGASWLACFSESTFLVNSLHRNPQVRAASGTLARPRSSERSFEPHHAGQADLLYQGPWHPPLECDQGHITSATFPLPGPRPHHLRFVPLRWSCSWEIGFMDGACPALWSGVSREIRSLLLLQLLWRPRPAGVQPGQNSKNRKLSGYQGLAHTAVPFSPPHPRAYLSFVEANPLGFKIMVMRIMKMMIRCYYFKGAIVPEEVLF